MIGPKLNFSLTQLEYVLMLNKYGHFGKAAEACSVTQPTLSMQIQKLEEELGVVIFDRSKKPILLTDTGKKLIDQIKATLFEAKKITNIVQSDLSDTQSGELVLGVIPTVAPYLLPRLLPTLEEQYAGLKLRIMELQTQGILEALESDEIDVGILATPINKSKVHELALYYEPFSVFCQRDHEYAHLKKIKYNALKTDDVWLLEEGHCLRNQVLDICSTKKSKNIERRYQFDSGNLETLKNLVSRYGGYTLLPYLAADNLGTGTKLINFERPIPAREIGLVYRREHYKNDLIEALGDAIIECIPEELRKIRPKDLDVLPI